MIQVATYGGKEIKYNGKLVEQYSLHDIRSLDEYEITVIDLSAPQLWECKSKSTQTINKMADLKSISEMIMNSSSSKVIILLPQNETFNYDYWDRIGYHSHVELKNILDNLRKFILSNLYEPIANMALAYENTKTKIGETELLASFYFKNAPDTLLKSIKSNKATAIRHDKIILTTLKMDGYDSLMAFLGEVHLLNEEEDVPEWILELEMFDDAIQKEIIDDCHRKIKNEQKSINVASEALDKNTRFKSALYTSGDALVEVVFEILQELLGCDLSQFVDVKKEDFLFSIEDTTFIGEIKGVNHNVKNTNITQLEVHYQDYLDEHQEVVEEKIKALLIMNHQKSKPIKEREPIMERQINLAKRNGSLIIDTFTLLKMLEAYRQGTLLRDEIIAKLNESTGVLTI